MHTEKRRYTKMKLFAAALLTALAFLVPVYQNLGFAATSTPGAFTYDGKCPVGQRAAKDANGDNKYVCCPAGTETNATSCIFEKYINPAIVLLGVIVGIVVVFGIVSGGIQYASSAGDPQKTAAGKGKIMKAIYGLLAFLFLYSALQFLSPGGINGAKAVPVPTAANCMNGSTFLTLKPWYAYLPTDAGTDSSGKTLKTFGTHCQIENFRLLADSSGPSMLPSILLVIVDDMMRVVGLIAVAYIIIGGIQYVTSQGEPDRTKHAQETIINALIGLVVAIVAASVVAFIGTRISS